MTDRPILFSTPMVRALLDGRKTQTRRVIGAFAGFDPRHDLIRFFDAKGLFICNNGGPPADACRKYEEPSVRFAVGDRLYVREAWRVTRNKDTTSPRDLPPRMVTTVFEAGGSMGGTEAPPKDRPRSAAEYVHDLNYPTGPRPEWVGRLRQGMHMPRWASRLTLTVTEVRVQRLQEISEVDARAEGLESQLDGDADDNGRARIYEYFRAADYLPWIADPIEAYADLWDQLNDSRGFGWETNPWVVAVSFSVEHHNIDVVAA